MSSDVKAKFELEAICRFDKVRIASIRYWCSLCNDALKEVYNWFTGKWVFGGKLFPEAKMCRSSVSIKAFFAVLIAHVLLVKVKGIGDLCGLSIVILQTKRFTATAFLIVVNHRQELWAHFGLDTKLHVQTKGTSLIDLDRFVLYTMKELDDRAQCKGLGGTKFLPGQKMCRGAVMLKITFGLVLFVKVEHVGVALVTSQRKLQSPGFRLDRLYGIGLNDAQKFVSAVGLQSALYIQRKRVTTTLRYSWHGHCTGAMASEYSLQKQCSGTTNQGSSAEPVDHCEK
jgi:hypothetical protein